MVSLFCGRGIVALYESTVPYYIHRTRSFPTSQPLGISGPWFLAFCLCCLGMGTNPNPLGGLGALPISPSIFLSKIISRLLLISTPPPSPPLWCPHAKVRGLQTFAIYVLNAVCQYGVSRLCLVAAIFNILKGSSYLKRELRIGTVAIDLLRPRPHSTAVRFGSRQKMALIGSGEECERSEWSLADMRWKE